MFSVEVFLYCVVGAVCYFELGVLKYFGYFFCVSYPKYVNTIHFPFLFVSWGTGGYFLCLLFCSFCVMCVSIRYEFWVSISLIILLSSFFPFSSSGYV
jgi:hypothetical protein